MTSPKRPCKRFGCSALLTGTSERFPSLSPPRCNLFSAYIWMCFAGLARSSWCLQCVSTHQPHWVYRDSEENFQSRCFSGKFGGSEERPCLSLPGVYTLELFWNNAEEPSADTSHTVSPIQPVKHTPESPSPMETQSFCRPLQKEPDVCGLMWSLRKNTFSESFSALWFNLAVRRAWCWAAGRHQDIIRAGWECAERFREISRRCENEL